MLGVQKKSGLMNGQEDTFHQNEPAAGPENTKVGATQEKESASS